MERHHKDVLFRHRQQSRYLPVVILRKTGQDVYVIQVGILEFTAHALDTNHDEEEDEYTVKRILSDSVIPAHQGDGYTRSDGRVLLH